MDEQIFYLFPIVSRSLMSGTLLQNMHQVVMNGEDLVNDLYTKERQLCLVYDNKIVARAQTFDQIADLLKSHYMYEKCVVVVPKLYNPNFHMRLRSFDK